MSERPLRVNTTTMFGGGDDQHRRLPYQQQPHSTSYLPNIRSDDDEEEVEDYDSDYGYDYEDDIKENVNQANFHPTAVDSNKTTDVVDTKKILSSNPTLVAPSIASGGDKTNSSNMPRMMDREPLLIDNDHDDFYDEEQERSKRRGHSQSYRAWLLWMIDVVQRQRAPTCCLSAINQVSIIVNRLSGKKTATSLPHHHHHGGSMSPQHPSNLDKPVRILSGLEKVFIYGTHPAADAVLILGIQPPRYLCYMISGMICDVIQFMFDFLLHSKHALGIRDASICWFVSFFISVFFRHTTLRYLVFGNYVGGYYQSLKRIYSGYSIIIVLSTAFNYTMTHSSKIHLPHYIAYIITLLWTGIVNYFILKKLWSFTGTTITESNTGGAKAPTTTTMGDSSIMNKIQLEKSPSDLSILSSSPSITIPAMDNDLEVQ